MYSLMANCFEWIRKRKEPNRAVTLVVIGLDDAGKTTMVASLQGEPPDGITPTIGFANAEFTINRCKVTAYDLGGGVRIRDVWRKYYSEVFGVVFVVDSCNNERLSETKDVLQKVIEHEKIAGKPFLIFANKQDKEGALLGEDVANVLDLENQSQKYTFPYKVFTCSALKGYGRSMDKNINAGFQWLLNTISSEFGKISARVEHDVAIQREEEEREKKARIERIKKIREERDRREREAGRDPDKEESDDDVMIANPFQPIGKHLEKLKSKERKKKIEKEKKQKAEQTVVEEESKDDSAKKETSSVKKKKKKKKKILKETEQECVNADDILEEVDGGVGKEEHHEDELLKESLNEDRPVVKKKKKKVKKKPKEDENVNADNGEVVVSTVRGEDHVVEKLGDSENEANVVVVKKKKKKPKVRSQENLAEDQDQTEASPTTKKGRKKKRTVLHEVDEGVSNDVGNELGEEHEIKREEPTEDYGSSIDNMKHMETGRQKKPKVKKRKKKRNRTAPIDSVPEEHDSLQQTLPPPVWRTPATSWTSLAPIGGNEESSAMGNLPPLRSGTGRKVLSDTSLQLPVSPSWTRTRPNSEDVDLIT